MKTIIFFIALALIGCATPANKGQTRHKRFYSLNSGSGTHYNDKVAWSYHDGPQSTCPYCGPIPDSVYPNNENPYDGKPLKP